MKISVVIVSWNAKEYLRECLTSLKSDVSGPDCEVFVVDNHSTDGSQEMVSTEFPNVKLVRNEKNLGFAAANNIGIRRCSAEYVLLINSDVVVKDNCIDMMFKYMNAHPDIGVLGPRIIDIKGNTQRSTMEFPTLWNTFCRALALDSIFPNSRLFGGYLMRCFDKDLLQDTEIINGCFWMIRSNALMSTGLLDESFFIYGEDMDWCKRFKENGWRVVYFPEAKALHYGGASSANAPIRFFIEQEKANAHYWHKHFPFPAYILYRLIILIHLVLRLISSIAIWTMDSKNHTDAVYKLKRSYKALLWAIGLLKNIE